MANYKYDDLLNEINGFGKFQKLRYLLICLAGLLPPMSTYVYSFLAARADYKCASPYSSSFANQTLKCESNINGTIYKCEAWEYDKTNFESTLTEEWNMICDYSFLRSKVQSIYFIGYLVGSIVFGNLSDKLGRRPIMLVSFVLIILGSIGSALGPQKMFGFLPSYIIFIICRFLIACGTRGINETGYVLVLELVSSNKRTYAGIGFEHFFSLGQLILVAIAYFIRDWRDLALVMIIPTIPFLAYYLILPESPRWLISKNRQKEAIEILKKVAKTNQKEFDENKWNQFLTQKNKADDGKNETFLTLIKSLVKKPAQSVLILTMFINWIVNNFVYYGVGLKSSDLGVNPYLSFAISAFVEMIAYSFTLLIINKIGRKKIYFIFLFTAGCSCLSIIFVENVIASVVLAMVGKFCVSASYAILRLYSNEVFPTSIRNSCMGACSTVSRIGVIIAPFINSLGDNGWKSLPFFIFGTCGLLTSFSTILLPETLNKSLPESIEDTQKLNASKKTKKNQKQDPLLLNGIANEKLGEVKA